MGVAADTEGKKGHGRITSSVYILGSLGEGVSYI
jgi:hypothetical protein